MNGVWRVQGVLATSRALGDYPLKVQSKDDEEIEDGGCGYEQGDFLSYSDGCGDLMLVVVVVVVVGVHLMVIMVVMIRTRKCWWQTLMYSVSTLSITRCSLQVWAQASCQRLKVEMC